MIKELLFLGGYGQFVWPAFIFTVASTFGLYLNTRNELKKIEKIYLENFYQTQSSNIKIAKQNDTLGKVLSNSRIFN